MECTAPRQRCCEFDQREKGSSNVFECNVVQCVKNNRKLQTLRHVNRGILFTTLWYRFYERSTCYIEYVPARMSTATSAPRDMLERPYVDVCSRKQTRLIQRVSGLQLLCRYDTQYSEYNNCRLDYSLDYILG